MQKRAFSLLFALFPLLAFSQKYEITIAIEGLKEPSALLVYQVADQQFRADSAAVDTVAGRVVFRGERPLPEGYFFVAAGKRRLFDFIVDADQAFEIRGSMAKLDSLESVGSAENAAFFELKKQLAPTEKQIAEAQQSLQMLARATRDRDALQPFYEKIGAANDRILVLSKAHLAKNPAFLYSKMLRMGLPPEPPKSLAARLPDGKPNPKMIGWLKSHFFDNVDFADARLLNCDVFPKKISQFFRDFVPTNIDSVRAGCDQILEKAALTEPFYRWSLVHLTTMFEKSEWQGAASVFCHLVDRYQKAGQNKWIDAATLERLRYKADAWRPTLIGSEAPGLELLDEKGQFFDLQKAEAAPTMVVFYSPQCAHCLEAMPGIHQNFLDFREKGLRGVAVACDGELDAWRKFLAANDYAWTDVAYPTANAEGEKSWAAFNLPVIYLVGRDRKIVARRVPAENLKDFLTAFLRN